MSVTSTPTPTLRWQYVCDGCPRAAQVYDEGLRSRPATEAERREEIAPRGWLVKGDVCRCPRCWEAAPELEAAGA